MWYNGGMCNLGTKLRGLKAWIKDRYLGLISIFTLIILILVGLAFISAFVMIMKPEPFQTWFPQVRESITALGTLAMVFATLLLAYATFRIITSNREQEKRNRKERRLKEIVDWATDILVCGRDISRELFKELVSGDTSDRARNIEITARFNVISWRGFYIRHISENLNRALYDNVLEAQRILRQHVKVLDLDFKGKIKNASAIGKHRDTLDNSAKRIIEIAVSLLSNKISSPS
jgi:hypothetical protein